jgi:hypothetical protein
MGLINGQTQVAPVKKQIAREYYRWQFRNSCTDVPERLRVNVGEDVSATCLMGVKRDGAELLADMCASVT